MSGFHAHDLTPRQIVAELDKYIVGQQRAKRVVAIAMRNRARRRLLSGALREEVSPKNILMMGPTGVGKTEIARRLAKLAGAPFLKVEATKYTEVGYVGRDVESMVRDLVEVAIKLVRDEQMEALRPAVEDVVANRLVDLLSPPPAGVEVRRRTVGGKPEIDYVLPQVPTSQQSTHPAYEWWRRHELLKGQYIDGKLEDREVEVQVTERAISLGGMPMGGPPGMDFNAPGMMDLSGLMEQLNSFAPKKKKTVRMRLSEARRTLLEEETEGLIDKEKIKAEALERAQNDGMIFIDEFDKIAGRASERVGADVSREGVQRDILPIVEGSTVQTKHGLVTTDHILFIAAGAFHMSKPSDLIPELQGRFPLRVELEPLKEEDFVRILTEPDNALTKQYSALLATEGIELVWEVDGIAEVARSAAHVNSSTENIGARRLHTILEKILEDISFEAPEMGGFGRVPVNKAFVQGALKGIVEDRDLSRYIL